MTPIKSYTNKHGRTVHYDEAGNRIGESRQSPSSGRIIHYDADGNETGRSYGNASGRMTHYDAAGNRTGTSYTAYPGRLRHFDADGERIGDTQPSFWGTTTRRAGANHSGPHQIGYGSAASPRKSQPVQSSKSSEWNGGCAILLFMSIIVGVIGLIGALIK